MQNIAILKILIISILGISSALADMPKVVFKNTETQYSLNWGNCPVKTSGDLAIILAREYDKSHSLFDLNKKIQAENWKEQYFLSSYEISYDMFRKKLSFNFNCPRILLRVQIFKNSGDNYYSGVLVDTGDVYDPNYEVILRREGVIQKKLPFLAMSLNDINEKKHLKVINLLNRFPRKLYDQLSEVVVDQNQELTLIMRNDEKVSSVFFGDDYWDDKLNSLIKINDYFITKQKYPSQINLTSNKKIVVKFSSI